MKRALVLVSLLAIAACAGDGLPGDGPSDPDAGAGSDGGPPGDAGPPACSASVSWPEKVQVNVEVELKANISDPTGPIEEHWTLTSPSGKPVAFELASGRRSIKFTPTTVGSYAIVFDAGQVSGCRDFVGHLPVEPPGAATQTWTVQVVPPAWSGLPEHAESVTVTGMVGATPTILLRRGHRESLIVVDSAGMPVEAALRFLNARGTAFAEAASGVDGRTQVMLDDDRHDVLVVPTSKTYAPELIANWTLRAPLRVTSPEAITGSVVDPAGNGLAGVRVALAVGGVPSTIAITDAGGGFSLLQARQGSGHLVVVPADDSPWSRLDADVVATPGAVIDIKYAARTQRQLGGALVRLGAAAAKSATVTLVGVDRGAATIQIGASTVTADGRVLMTAPTDATGHLGPRWVPALALSALVEVAQAGTVADIDATAGTPTVIDAPAAVAITGRITSPGGNAVAGALVSAEPQDARASVLHAAAPVLTDRNGRYALPAAPGISYQVTASDPGGGFVAARRTVTGGATADLQLGDAVRITGLILVDGSQSAIVRGGSVVLLCAECDGPERTRPVSVAAIAGNGAFVLPAPDPGIAAP